MSRAAAYPLAKRVEDKAIAIGLLAPTAILIPLATMVPYALLTGRKLRGLFSPAGLGVFALVALPWFLAVSSRIPEFPHYVFVRETFERVTSTRFHRTAPFWYYLPIVPVAAYVRPCACLRNGSSAGSAPCIRSITK